MPRKNNLTSDRGIETVEFTKEINAKKFGGIYLFNYRQLAFWPLNI